VNEIQIAIVYHSETGNTRQMAELVRQGCLRVAGVKARCMPVDDVDGDYVAASKAAILGSPTYEGSCTWQMKRYLDTAAGALAGKLGAVFASQNWPGGGGASFAEMTMIAGMLVRGMLIYSGGTSQGQPYLHFGAVSRRAPEEELYGERCLKLGENVARKAVELFAKG
jgi:NAD(P)H dehydrogenase (quinone)